MYWTFAYAVIQIPGYLKIFKKMTLLIQLVNNNNE